MDNGGQNSPIARTAGAYVGVGDLPYGGLAALAQEAPRATAPVTKEDDSRGAGMGEGVAGGVLITPVGNNDAEAASFLAGYRDHGGNPALERHFVDSVIPCESGWEWERGDSFHLSVAQFHPKSWATAAEATGLADPENLYHVGAAVAWWSNEVGPEAPAGWACF